MCDIIFFQATGRSGTQWFAKQLQDVYSDLAEVAHEPIQYAWQPKRFFRRYSPAAYKEMQALPEVQRHLEHIEEISQSKTYVEIGFPSYAAIPALSERFGDRLKLVHLIRNPVLTAASQVTHGWYSNSKRPELAALVLPTPEDLVQQWYYRENWHRLTQFEKCLFFWSEFHLHALELHSRYPDMPYHRIRFEDVFGGNSPVDVLKQLIEFMGLPWREELESKVEQKEDKWSRKTSELGDWHDVYDHPQTLALSLQFGYNLELATEHELKARYLKSVSLPQRIKHRLSAVLH